MDHALADDGHELVRIEVADLIRREIESLIDPKRWRKAVARENRSRKLIANAANNRTKVEKLLERRQ